MNEKRQELDSSTVPGPDCLPTEWIVGYVNGDLDEKERALVEAHMQSCSHCRQAVDGLAEAVQRRDKQQMVARMEAVLEQQTQTVPALRERADQKRYLWADVLTSAPR